MSGDRLVYSSEAGRMCPDCGRSPSACRCPRRHAKQRAQAPRREDPKDGVARVRREKKGRKGKTVTTISGLPLREAELVALAGELKRRCGSGGALKDGVIEIQGDHLETVLGELERRDLRAVRAGG